MRKYVTMGLLLLVAFPSASLGNGALSALFKTEAKALVRTEARAVGTGLGTTAARTETRVSTEAAQVGANSGVVRMATRMTPVTPAPVLSRPVQRGGMQTGFTLRVSPVRTPPPRIINAQPNSVALRPAPATPQRGATRMTVQPSRLGATVPSPPLQFNGKIQRKMRARGWTEQQVRQAVSESRISVPQKKGGVRYVHPKTGKSVVVHPGTGKVHHVGESRTYKYDEQDTTWIDTPWITVSRREISKNLKKLAELITR